MEQERFSLQKRLKSFQYAASGLRLIFKTDHNVWLHLAATVLVVTLAIFLKVSSTDAALLALALGIVWIAELFNTCLEKVMDFISKETHPTIKWIKDVSAGAVLIASITAVIIGCFVFVPKIMYI
jgi:diacylglycerol kinase